MAYTKDSLQRLFQSKFNLPKWQMVLQDYFRADKVRKSPEALDEDAEERKGYFLGETMTKDGYKMGFFYYGMEDGSVLRRKVGLRNLIRPYLGYGFDAALAVFDDGKNWRLSLICDLKGDAEATNAKRFTYVFGDEKAYYKTPVARFLDLQKKADEYLEIKNAFSVEALSDDFFDEYRKQYAEFVKFLTGKVYVKKGNKMVEQEVDEPDAQFFTSFGKDEKLVRDYIKKMMGRIVFLYFLQSKGWLGGNLHYMHDLFDNASDAIKADFLDKVLEPMFFGLLNTKPEDRATAPLVNGVGVKYVPHAEAIPYLNGGLFQQEQIDEVDSCFPAKMFQSLFDFFDSYNFTIDENDPNDAEVGVDPEMLGKIFENLLEDNKDKGAFYTPKEIVRYMCQESLIAYLQTGIEDEETKKSIANFVKTNDVEELGGASSELAMSIDQKLKDVKICDPAIGSGAFPMGLLRELYACRKAIKVFESDNAADIKRHIIQNNIYGVDIEKGAVDIARLRFWLALIIDEKEPMPLPNLDFKIMQGNSLLESYKGVDLSQMQNEVKRGDSVKIKGRRSKQMVMSKPELALVFEEKDALKNIQDLVKKYFDITDHQERDECRNQINHYIKDYIKKCGPAIADEVDELEIPNSQFFLWHTYFADVFEKGGFDIVIGNPPYVEAKKLKYIASTLKKSYTVYSGTADLSIYFIEHGMNLLAQNGILSYITTNKFFNTGYGKAVRKYLVGNQINALINFEQVEVFEDILVSSVVINVRKSLPVDNNKFEYERFYQLNAKQFRAEFAKKIDSFGSYPQEFLDENEWSFADVEGLQLKRKIEKDSNRLESIEGVSIYRGVTTGYNPAFIITDVQRQALISEDERNSEVIKNMLQGRNVRKWYYDESDENLLFMPWHFPLHNDSSLRGASEKAELSLKEEYPTIYQHLLVYKDALLLRNQEETGIRYEWYALQRCAASYYHEFEKTEKIIWGLTANNWAFAYDDKQHYLPSNGYILTSEQIPIKYLLGWLNSKLMHHYFHYIGVMTAGGAYTLKAATISALPFKKPKAYDVIVEKVDAILLAKNVDKQADTTSLENQIDFLIYHLYGLTYDEVLIVDPETPISREEYEAYNIEQLKKNEI
mgnify:CR=1 FL=1